MPYEFRCYYKRREPAIRPADPPAVLSPESTYASGRRWRAVLSPDSSYASGRRWRAVLSPDSTYASGRRWRAVLSSGSIGAPRITTIAHRRLQSWPPAGTERGLARGSCKPKYANTLLPRDVLAEPKWADLLAATTDEG